MQDETGLQRRRRKLLYRLNPAVKHLLRDARFADISVERIISVAGIARSTFYAYFDDKGHLLRFLGADAVTAFLEASKPWSNLPENATRDDLQHIFTDFAAIYREHSLIIAAMSETSMYDPGVADEFRRLIRSGSADLEKHVRAGQESDVVRKEIDPERSISWLVSMIERGLYHNVRNAEEAELSQHIETMTDIVWQTLYVGAPGRDRS